MQPSKIYIPTYRRATREQQLTHKMLPYFLADNVTFVVRAEEAEFFKRFDCDVEVLPSDVTNIAQTRQHIQKIAGDSYHWVMDDDIIRLGFIQGWKDEGLEADELKESDWDKWTSFCEYLWSEISKPGVLAAGFAGHDMVTRDCMLWPVQEGYPILQWFCLKGTSFVDWSRVNLCDDVDGELQIMQKGKVVRLARFMFERAPEGSKGGRSDQLTVTAQHEAFKQLESLWPGIVKVQYLPREGGFEARVNIGWYDAVQKFKGEHK